MVASTGSFVVAWVSAGMTVGQDGSYVGIFARRLAASALPTLDLDGNGMLGPLTDGLLFLRYLFEFSGATLTGGAVDAGPAPAVTVRRSRRTSPAKASLSISTATSRCNR